CDDYTYTLLQSPNCRNASFFFSSRRRHTRCLSDWSSDVCSSDLSATGLNIIGLSVGAQRPLFNWTAAASALLQNIAGCWIRNCEIGRASCRERVLSLVSVGVLQCTLLVGTLCS